MRHGSCVVSAQWRAVLCCAGVDLRQRTMTENVNLSKKKDSKSAGYSKRVVMHNACAKST
jgi:hypothetical protein